MSDIFQDKRFIELLLGHICLHPEVFSKAKSYGLAPEDFTVHGPFQLPTYATFFEIMAEIGCSPIHRDLLELLIDSRAQTGHILPNIRDDLMSLISRIYVDGTPDMSAYFVQEIPKFIRSRRSAKILSEAGFDIDKIHQEYEKIIFPLDTLVDSSEPIEERFIRPFDSPIKKVNYSLIPTGFPRLNGFLGGGLGYRELGLIVGHSGGGKTALGVSICKGAALTGFKTLYCSMEEMREDVSNRLYSSVFNIDYSSLHNTSGYFELDEKFVQEEYVDTLNLLRSNFVVFDLRGCTPITPGKLKKLLDDFAVENNYYFDLLVVDQLQFMEPDSAVPGDQIWITEKKTVKELDQISHLPLGAPDSDKYFGMWVIHQARGKVQLNFTVDEISGFKGIVHQPDTVLGIGRENPQSDEFEVFSMKNRHNKNFRLPMQGDLQFMNFIEKEGGPAEEPAPQRTTRENTRPTI